jgi:hypothetical protein
LYVVPAVALMPELLLVPELLVPDVPVLDPSVEPALPIVAFASV